MSNLLSPGSKKGSLGALVLLLLVALVILVENESTVVEGGDEGSEAEGDEVVEFEVEDVDEKLGVDVAGAFAVEDDRR